MNIKGRDPEEGTSLLDLDLVVCHTLLFSIHLHFSHRERTRTYHIKDLLQVYHIMFGLEDLFIGTYDSSKSECGRVDSQSKVECRMRIDRTMEESENRSRSSQSHLISSNNNTRYKPNSIPFSSQPQQHPPFDPCIAMGCPAWFQWMVENEPAPVVSSRIIIIISPTQQPTVDSNGEQTCCPSHSLTH